MKRSIFISIIILILITSCNKENQRIASAYQLDSVAISIIDTLGNETYAGTFIIEQDFIINNIPSYLLYDGTTGISFDERNDSIIYQQILEAPDMRTQVFNYCCVTDDRFNSFYNKRLTSSYSDASTYINRQYINYNLTKNLESIVNTNDFFTSSDTSSFTCESRQTQELSFLYTGNNISSINFDCTLSRYPFADAINYNSTGNSITYSNKYPNQKDLIGLDVNDIILSSLLDLSLLSPISYYRSINYLYLGLSSTMLNYYLPNMSESLVFTKHTTFNTNCDYLMEHIHFNYSPLTNNSFYLPFNSAPDINLSYEFDAMNSNRITQLTIQPSSPPFTISYPNNSYYTNLGKVRYKFYYKK